MHFYATPPNPTIAPEHNPKATMLRAQLFYTLLPTLALIILSNGCKNTAREPLLSPKKSSFSAEAFTTNRNAPTPEGPSAPALILLTDLQGYTEPCGCTEDVVYGGLDRIVGSVHAIAKANQAPTLFAVAGNTLFQHEHKTLNAQNHARMQLLIRALTQANVRVHGVGPNDLQLGLEIFEEFATKLPTTFVSTNVSTSNDEDEFWVPAHIETVGEVSVAFLNIIHPSAFESEGHKKALVIEDIHESLRDALHEVSIKNADLRVLFAHGDKEKLATITKRFQELDIVITSTDRAATDRVRAWGALNVLSLWSHGRALGMLRLHAPDSTENAETVRWENARTLSRAEAEEYSALIAHLSTQIETLDAAIDEGDPLPAIRTTLAERRDRYQQALDDAAAAHPPTFAADQRQFLWDVFEITPDRPHDPAVHADQQRYNRSLQELHLDNAAPPPKAKAHEASYVGAQQCATCHQDATEFWRTTAHATAYNTLTERNKAYDLDCVSCHVTGYAQPGGSSLGHTENLENVQCESCHGPGSLHASAPTTNEGAQHIVRDGGDSSCVSCHSPEHSTRFDYDAYRTQILGPGHGQTP